MRGGRDGVLVVGGALEVIQARVRSPVDWFFVVGLVMAIAAALGVGLAVGFAIAS